MYHIHIFFKITKKVKKVQSIKTGGFFSKFDDFIDMTIQRSIHNVREFNTICIDEKPFIQRKYETKKLRVHQSFRGKGMAKLVDINNPLNLIKPKYILCAISSQSFIFYTISDEPISSNVYNTFIFKLFLNYLINSNIIQI